MSADDVEEVAAEGIDIGDGHLGFSDEPVVGHDGWNGSEEPHGGGDEGVGHGSCDLVEDDSASFGYSVEGLNDAPDRSKEADEWSGAACGAEEWDQSFESVYFIDGSPSDGSFDVFDSGEWCSFGESVLGSEA